MKSKNKIKFIGTFSLGFLPIATIFSSTMGTNSTENLPKPQVTKSIEEEIENVKGKMETPQTFSARLDFNDREIYGGSYDDFGENPKTLWNFTQNGNQFDGNWNWETEYNKDDPTTLNPEKSLHFAATIVGKKEKFFEFDVAQENSKTFNNKLHSEWQYIYKKEFAKIIGQRVENFMFRWPQDKGTITYYAGWTPFSFSYVDVLHVELGFSGPIITLATP